MHFFSVLSVRRVKTISLYVLLLGMGYIQAYLREPTHRFHHFTSLYSTYLYSEVIVQDDPEKREHSYRVEVEVVRMYNKNSMVTVHGKALLYLMNTDSISDLHAGQHLLLPNVWQDIPEPKNPGAFNYRTYCATHGVYRSARLKSEECIMLHQETSFLFQNASKELRNRLTSFLPDSSTWSLAQALLLGYRKGMDSELYQAYAQTGVMHLIAISGMHMGLLYLAFNYVLCLLPFLKEKKRIVPLFTCLGLWLFAFLVGLQPSILRSAVMFTLIGMGTVLQRNSNLLNNLSCSAFLLLCFFPNWLFDAGFQLSYLAVLSLYFYFKPIYSFFFIKRRVPDELWKLVSVTLAAQILTFPLTFYYFHQFPLTFLLTNIIGIITTTLIIYLEVILLLFSCFHPIAFALGQVISFLIHVTNDMILWFSCLKWNTLQGINLSVIQIIFLYIIMASLSIFLFFQLKKWVYLTLFTLLLLLNSMIHNRWTTLHQHKFVSFVNKNQETFAFIRGEKMSFYSDSGGPSAQTDRYIFQPAKDFFHAHSEEKTRVFSQSFPSFDLFQQGNMIVIRLKNRPFHSIKPIHPDVLILPEYASIQDFEWIKELVTRKETWLALPNRQSQTTAMLGRKLRDSGFRVHDPSIQSALVLESP